MLCAILMLYYLAWSKGFNCLITENKIFITSHSVDLSRRHFTEIPQNIPADTEIIYLNYNEIKTIPNGIFVNLSRLVILDLSSNIINSIFADSFEGLSKLEVLYLQQNQLTRESLHNGSFTPLTSLKTLDISQNIDSSGDLNIMFSDELYRLRLLDTLFLDAVETDHSQINKFECFKNLTRLAFINNQMTVTNKTFENFQDLPIEELSIFDIRSAEKGAFNFFPKLLKLTLELSWEALSLQNMFPVLEVFKGRNMTEIAFTNNAEIYLFKLDESHLRYLQDICLKEINLNSNNIIDIDADSLTSFARKSTCLEAVDMSDNPLLLNNFYYWLFPFHLFENLKVIRFSRIGFHPSTERSIQMTIQSTITLLLPPTLQEVYISLRPSVRPFGLPGFPNLTAIHGQSMKTISFQIEYSHCLGGFRGFPNLIELDISRFDCSFLNPDILQFLPRLEKFVAQNANLNHGFSFVRDSGARFFAHQFNLSYVDLAANNLQGLHSEMFKDHEETLRYLYLGKNNFKNIPISINTFKFLQILDLTYNRIEYFDQKEQEVLEKNINIDIRLSGNPFACTCNHTNFLRWIKNRGQRFFVNVECIGEDRTWHNISEIIGSLEHFELNCVLTFWLYFSIIMSSFLCSLLFMVSLYYRYRSEIQYFFLKLRIKIKRYKALEERHEYQFDAFLSYSSSDSSWVAQFYRQLTNNGFNLCFDARHFVAGDTIAENIVRAIDSSRKIIFIVTRNFLNSSWGRYEIEMTRMHAFREGRENMVILIIKDEIPSDEMPRILLEMWNKIVCLKYTEHDESFFYDSVALCLR